MVDEFTRVVNQPRPPASPTAATQLGAVDDGRVNDGADDGEVDERTRLMRPRTVVSAPVPAPSGEDLDEAERTRLVASRGRPAAPEPVPNVSNTAGGTAEQAWASFVFVQVALLAVVVTAAVAMPFLAGWGDRLLEGVGLLWLGIAGVVVIAMTYLTGARIVAHAKAASLTGVHGGN